MTQSQIFGCDEKNHDLIRCFWGTVTLILQGRYQLLYLPKSTGSILLTPDHHGCYQAVTISITCGMTFPFTASWLSTQGGIHFPSGHSQLSTRGTFIRKICTTQVSCLGCESVSQYCERPIYWILTFLPHPPLVTFWHHTSFCSIFKLSYANIKNLCFTKSRFVWDQYWQGESKSSTPASLATTFTTPARLTIPVTRVSNGQGGWADLIL